jgi:hypothetical protein
MARLVVFFHYHMIHTVCQRVQDKNRRHFRASEKLRWNHFDNYPKNQLKLSKTHKNITVFLKFENYVSAHTENIYAIYWLSKKYLSPGTYIYSIHIAQE